VSDETRSKCKSGSGTGTGTGSEDTGSEDTGSDIRTGTGSEDGTRIGIGIGMDVLLQLCNKCGLFERTHMVPRPAQIDRKRYPVATLARRSTSQ
jgi:hypothetical protein